MKTSRHQNLARRKRRIERRLRRGHGRHTRRDVPGGQHRVRAQRAGAGAGEWRDRRDASVGAAHGVGRGDRSARGGVEGGAAASGIGSRAGRRLQRAVWGTCLQDIERLRQDEVYLDALGAQRIPDPTTAGDFCRRFPEADIEALQTTINETRARVWRAQPAGLFEEAIIDADDM